VSSIEKFDEKKFGEKLKELRKNKGLKIRELEGLAGVSNAYLSQLENGKRGKPSPDIIKKLAPHLGVTYTELMKLAGFITEDIDQEALELLKLEDIEEVFEYAFEQFFNDVSKDGEVIKEFRDIFLGHLTGLDPNLQEHFSEENMKSRQFWEEIFNQLSFQEKLEFLLLLKKDMDISQIYRPSDEEDKNVLESKQNYYSKNDIEQPGKTVQVPILGYIAAGQPIFADEHIIDYEEVPGEFNKDHFMLIVKGDSMKGSRIYPGDKVVVKMQPEVENGEIAVVNVSGEDATLKKVKKYEDGSVWLISTNEKYAPIPLQRSSRIIGKVIKVIFEP
jgi:SOS-response transcriptional repressor LexA/DNA-binding XRE family transcriptional regulator